MKKYYYLLKFKLLVIISFFCFTIFAQSPEKMSYQAIIRNSSNQLVTNQIVGMQIRILKDTLTGTAIYVETQTPTTNINGLVSLEIGTGNVVLGNFSTIDWSDGPYFLKTETDPDGGILYSIVGISQLLSVPYALHSKTADSIFGGLSEIDPVFNSWNKDYTDLINKPDIVDSINTYGFDGDYLSLSNLPVLFDGNYFSLINLPNFHDSIISYGISGDYNDLINKPDIVDSINTYGFDGDYLSLSNLPALFDSNYFNLINLPDFQDSIFTYGFNGNYNNLTNKPSIIDSINAYGFDGDYLSLSNLPVLFDSNYFNLINLPDFQDSIFTYGFNGNYNNLINKPDIADSISIYGFDGDYLSLSNLPALFDSNYFNLINLPDFQDSIFTYGFNGDYNNLINKPNIADSISIYGFDGDYLSLSNLPVLFDGNYNSLTNKPNFADSIASKAVLLTGNQTIQGNKTFLGTINAGMQKITNVGTPVQDNDATTKAYVDLLLDKILELQAELGVTDMDGNHYKAVKINKQVWMAENLKTTKYKDGTPINLVSDNNAWEILTTGARSWYSNDSASYASYGCMYNWYAVNTSKLCPVNWHVPSSSEITTLINYLGGQNIAGGKLKSTRTQPDGHPRWSTPNSGATDEAGFSALPGGYRDFDGLFDGVGVYAYWWSSTPDDTENSYYWGIINNNIITTMYPYINTLGYSIRCVRN